MTVRVIAPTKSDPIPDLKHLTIVQAPDNENLPPLDTRDRLTAKIPTTGLLHDDKLQVFLVGGPGSDPRGSNQSPLLDVGFLNPRTLNLSKEVVAFLPGNTMTLTYRITRDGVTSPDSEPLVLKVLDLPADALEQCRIFGRDDDGTGPVLDLTTDPDDRMMRINNWPLIAVGQWCVIRLKGKKADGTDYEPILFNEQVDQEWITRGNIEVPVPYGELEQFANGKLLAAGYTVAFDRDEHAANPHPSMVRSYTVKNAIVVRPEIVAVTDSNGAVIPNGEPTTAPDLMFTGTAAADQELRFLRNGNYVDSIFADDEGQWEYKYKQEGGVGKRLIFHYCVTTPDGAFSAMWLVVWMSSKGTPTVNRVTDSRGEHIPAYSATVESTVMLEGTAEPNEEVNIWLAASGSATATARANPDGVWRHTFIGLKTQRTRILLKALYGEGLEDNWPRELNIVEVEDPVITSVTDSFDRFIPQFGTTYDKTIKLTGTAKGDREIQVFIGGKPFSERFKADAHGVWKYTLTFPKPDGNITVKAFYGKETMSHYAVIGFSILGASSSLRGPTPLVAGADGRG